MTRVRLARLTAVTIIAATLCGCTALQMVSESVFLISPAQEAELGREIAKEIEKDTPPYRGDPEATAYIQSLGKRLVAAAPPCAQEFRFELVDKDDVNAYAIPGGSCYIHVGLLRVASNESELAGVVAHEIGHVVARHGAKSLSRSQFYGALGQVVLGEEAGQLSELAVSIVQSGVLTRHSREAELEADSISVKTLASAGINPTGMERFLRKLAEMKQRTPWLIEQMFSTHPPTAERVSRVHQQVVALGPPDANWTDDSLEFRRIKKSYPASP